MWPIHPRLEAGAGVTGDRSFESAESVCSTIAHRGTASINTKIDYALRRILAQSLHKRSRERLGQGSHLHGNGTINALDDCRRTGRVNANILGVCVIEKSGDDQRTVPLFSSSRSDRSPESDTAYAHRLTRALGDD
ncbi:hypothetical protein G6F40_014750 [Rhizopus arrhizus]|nr:hypothetical protein G6F40_014750 [Rhizopus arrhizus]